MKLRDAIFAVSMFSRFRLWPLLDYIHVPAELINPIRDKVENPEPFVDDEEEKIRCLESAGKRIRTAPKES